MSAPPNAGTVGTATTTARVRRAARQPLLTAAAALLGVCSCTAPSSGPTTVTRLPDDPTAASASARPTQHRPGGPRPPGALWRDAGSPSDALLRAGDAAWAQGELRAADDAYRRAAASAPGDPAPLVGMARTRLALAGLPTGFNSAPGDATLREVIAQLRRAVSFDPTFAPAQVELGRALLVDGDAAAALGPLQNAASQAEKDPEAHSALGIALLGLGRTVEATGALQRAADLDPDAAERHANLGTALLMVGRADDAVAAYRRAAALAPEDAAVLSNLGAALLAAGHPQDAIGVLERAVARAPEAAAHHANLGHALALTGALDRGIEQLRAALELDPKLTSAWLNLGTALARQGLLAEARRAYENARTLEPDDPTVRAAIEDLDKLAAPAAGSGAPAPKPAPKPKGSSK